MVENRPAATVLAHLTLILGVLIIGFPVYLTFVASTIAARAGKASWILRYRLNGRSKENGARALP